MQPQFTTRPDIRGTFGAIATTQLTVDNVAPALDLTADPAAAGNGGSWTITGSAWVESAPTPPSPCGQIAPTAKNLLAIAMP